MAAGLDFIHQKLCQILTGNSGKLAKIIFYSGTENDDRIAFSPEWH
jgi:hypothetical protein